MIRLLARTSALMLFFAVAILFARLVGSTKPNTALFSLLFTNPDGSPCERPCIFGIEPGKITFFQGDAILKQHPATARLDLRPTSSGFFSAFFAYDQFTVDVEEQYIQLAFFDLDFAAGDVIAYFGLPASVDLYGDASPTSLIPLGFHLNYKTFRVSVERTASDYVLSTDKVVMVLVQTDLDAEIIGGQWQGFGRANKYPPAPP